MEAVTRLGLAVLAPLMTGVVTLLLPRSAIRTRVALAVAGPVASFALIVWHLALAGVGSVGDSKAVLPWIPTLNLNLAFLPDGLGVFFALLVAGVGTLIVLYARSYFGPEPDALYRFYPTLGFFTTAMLGIVLADYLLLTLLFWELTSISSFLLIGWERSDRKAVKLAMQAFFTTGFGGLALFGGILLFGSETGIWRWSELLGTGLALDVTNAWTSPLMWAFVLMFIGAATKSAQFPWHYWLPGAMEAPTPVSAFLHSATMVKAGVFLVGRMFPAFSAMELWPQLIIPVGAVTMLLGAALAINQHDLKRIFAYTTVSQLGLLMCMYGLGAIHFEDHYHHVHLPAIDWDITQIANHAFYKAPLFILAGAIGHIVGTRELPRLFGYAGRHMPTALLLILAGYALAAGPGTISFQAKELFLYAIYHAAEVYPILWVVMGMAVLTAIFNVAIFVRLVTTVLGLPGGLERSPAEELAAEAKEDPHGHEPDEHHHEHGLWGAMLWLPAAIILLPQFVGGIYTPWWNAVFEPVETARHYFAEGVPALWEVSWGTPLMMSLIAYGGGIVLGFAPVMRGVVVDVFDRMYPAMYRLAVEGGGVAFRVVQTGHLRHYLVFVMGAFLVGFALAVRVDPGMAERVIATLGTATEFWPGILIAVIVCATALGLPLTDSRVLRVLLLGTCGFSVVAMYLVYQAPDLALTQVMVELISVILFVLVLRLLPESDTHPATGRLWRLALSLAVGVALGWLTLVAATTDRPPMLGEFFAQHSYKGTELTDYRGGGGANVVNVILVDFRGFDTLGEITVLALAAMGVWSLLPARERHRYRPRRLRGEVRS